MTKTQFSSGFSVKMMPYYVQKIKSMHSLKKYHYWYSWRLVLWPNKKCFGQSPIENFPMVVEHNTKISKLFQKPIFFSFCNNTNVSTYFKGIMSHVEWPNGIKHVWSPSTRTKCFTIFVQMFVDVQILSNTIKRDQSRCPNGKMFGHQTMFDRVWSPNISRLDRTLRA